MRAQFALFFFLAALPAAAAPAPRLTADGLAPLRIGMTEAQARRLLGRNLQISSAASGNAEACEDGGISDRPGIYIMLRRHRIVMIGIDGDHADNNVKAIGSADGVRIGTTEAQLKAIFGKRAIFTDRPYWEGDPNYHRVIVKVQGQREFVFDTSKRVVDSLSIGDLPGVEAMEGCA